MRKLTVSFLLLALLSLLPYSAAAHSQTFYHGSDYTVVGSSHKYIQVCDRESDSNSYFVNIMLSDGDWRRIYDLNGSASPCASTTYSIPIVTIQQCELVNAVIQTTSCYGYQSVY